MVLLTLHCRLEWGLSSSVNTIKHISLDWRPITITSKVRDWSDYYVVACLIILSTFYTYCMCPWTSFTLSSWPTIFDWSSLLCKKQSLIYIYSINCACWEGVHSLSFIFKRFSSRARVSKSSFLGLLGLASNLGRLHRQDFREPSLFPTWLFWKKGEEKERVGMNCYRD